MRKTISRFEAKYNRIGYVALSDEAECSKCGEKRIAIVIDSSMDEYGPGAICFKCIDDVVEEMLEKIHDPTEVKEILDVD